MLNWQLADGWAAEPTHKINGKDLGNPPLANSKIRHEKRLDVIVVGLSSTGWRHSIYVSDTKILTVVIDAPKRRLVRA